MEILPGMVAPDFSLYNTEKHKVSLADYQGKNVLLLFFPFAFTSTCTVELCNVRDNISFYNNVNAEVIGISVDAPYSLKKYKEEQNLNFTLLSDFNKEASENYNSLYPVFSMELRGVSKRSAFVIDKDGIIRYAEILENASLIPDFEKINQTLNSL